MCVVVVVVEEEGVGRVGVRERTSGCLQLDSLQPDSHSAHEEVGQRSNETIFLLLVFICGAPREKQSELPVQRGDEGEEEKKNRCGDA